MCGVSRRKNETAKGIPFYSEIVCRTHQWGKRDLSPPSHHCTEPIQYVRKWRQATKADRNWIVFLPYHEFQIRQAPMKEEDVHRFDRSCDLLNSQSLNHITQRFETSKSPAGVSWLCPDLVFFTRSTCCWWKFNCCCLFWPVLALTADRVVADEEDEGKIEDTFISNCFYASWLLHKET